MNDWYEQSIKMLQLNGKGERTQEAYTRAVRMLVEFCGKSPERITEAELQEYFLHRRNVDQWSAKMRRTYGPEYLERYGDTLPFQHHKVIAALMNCRTDAYGEVLYQCDECGHVQSVPRSCGNRHCPGCQHHKTQQWLQKHLDQQLAGPHFMLTFTVPEALRTFILNHQPPAYHALFSASAEAIKTLVREPKFIGADLPGFFGVLHTWGRQLQYHPHIHYVVPSGAFCSDDQQWHPTSSGLFLPVHALATLYQAKFRELMAKGGWLEQIPAEGWNTPWNVNCQAVGSSEASVKYLAHYVFKVAITDNRIVNVDNDQVTFRYRHPHSQRERTLTLDALEFIRRFLQHVLPAGFMKVRYYGFLHPSSALSLEEVKARIEMAYGFALSAPDPEPVCPASCVCRCCGGPLNYLGSVLPLARRPAPFLRYEVVAVVPSG